MLGQLAAGHRQFGKEGLAHPTHHRRRKSEGIGCHGISSLGASKIVLEFLDEKEVNAEVVLQMLVRYGRSVYYAGKP